LTEAGRELARTITEYAMAAQSEADSGISDDELQAFYATLQKLSENLSRLSERPKMLKQEAM
jgi:DNA-binding MarR family transcriptional regulator